MSLLTAETATDRAEHPVDIVERLAALNEWVFNRDDDDEISISVTGTWADYHMAFTWLPQLETLHIGCAFDLKVPERRRQELLTLVSTLNEQIWVGHFELWAGEGVVMFRQALILAGGAMPNSRQCEVVLSNALENCERYYQAFQFVVWAGKTVREALEAAMFETHGHA
jgi:hypothetical protein